MSYYYNLRINLNDIYYMFYEWNIDDVIEKVKKIPIYRVDSKTIFNLINNNIKIDKNILDNIYNKTKLKNNKYLEYVALFSDGKNNIVLEFNNEGLSINRSSLLLDDDLDVSEYVYSLDISNIKYNIINKLECNRELRQKEIIKKLILLEINNLYNSKNYNKLKYLYIEWFNEYSDDSKYIYKSMIDRINNRVSNDEYKIYEIIRNSYNNV